MKLALPASLDLSDQRPTLDTEPKQSFPTTVIHWQRQHGRHTLPWQNTQDAYCIWLSEIMLQQTQVTAVIPYYERFIQTFPNVASLAQAPVERVMEHWSGLGYYSRARNLHRCAQRVCDEHVGHFPEDPAVLAQLPGIGRSTAAAIAAFAYGRRAAILDGNVKRVFCRYFGVEGHPGGRVVEQALWQQAEALLPSEAASENDMARYTQGLMDLGATICTRSRPACERCPLQTDCVALATDRVTVLPTPKPRKAVPQRHVGMLVVLNQNGQILLQQRPERGIWGGLLSLPEFAVDVEDGAVSLSDNGPASEVLTWLEPVGALSQGACLPAVAHAFTHFRLQILPYRLSLIVTLDSTLPSGYCWCSLDAIAQAALPAPIKKLLLGLDCQAVLALS